MISNGYAVVLSVVAACMLSPSVAAQDFPSRPIRLIVPFAPGGSADLIARTLGKGVQASTGQPAVVENIGGSGGLIGATKVAKGTSDGYSLLITQRNSLASAFQRNDVQFAASELDTIAVLGSIPLVLVVNSGSPVQTASEFIQLARRNSGKFQVGVPQEDGTEHQFLKLMNSTANINTVAVPYRGQTQVLADLLGKTLDGALLPLNAVQAHPNQGQFRVLATTSRQRPPEVRDLPTIAETLQSAQCNESIQYVLYAPAGTPDAVKRRIREVFLAQLGKVDLIKAFQGFGVKPGGPNQVPGTCNECKDKPCKECGVNCCP